MPGHLCQHQVALVVAQGVIDGFEIVQVHKQQRPLALVALAGTHGQCQAVHQQASIGQAGQRVIKGELLDLVSGRLALGHVSQHNAQHRCAQGTVGGAHRHMHPKRRTVLADHAQLIRLGTAGLEQLFAQQVIGIGVSVVNETVEYLRHQPAAGRSQQGSCAAIGLQNMPGIVDRAVANRGQVIQVGVVQPRGIQRILGLAQLIVLHLQFDLVDAQLMHGALQVLGRGGGMWGIGMLGSA